MHKLSAKNWTGSKQGVKSDPVKCSNNSAENFKTAMKIWKVTSTVKIQGIATINKD